MKRRRRSSRACSASRSGGWLAHGKQGALPALKSLRLYNCEIGDEGMKALMAAADGGGLSNLEILGIQMNNTVGEEGIEALADAIDKGVLPSLTRVAVSAEHEFHPRLRAACAQRRVQLSRA